MPLYYLKGEAGEKSPPSGRLIRFILLSCSLLILLSGVIQSLGFLRAVEENLEHLLPHQVKPTRHPTVLLSIDGDGKDFGALDIAMALRGLGKLRAEKVLINGLVASGEESLPMLPEIVKDLEKTGVSIVTPHPPSLDSEFRAILLNLYDPPPCWGLARNWPVLSLKVSIHGCYNSGFFLPPGGTTALSLLGTDQFGQIVGSIWWAGLPISLHENTAWLLFGRLLLLPNQSMVWLNSRGEFKPGYFSRPGNCIEFPLDNFLLQLEQKERGIISPGFDSIWDHSTVVIGRPADISKVQMLDVLLDQTRDRGPTLAAQACITLAWIFLFLKLATLRWARRTALSISFLISWISLTLVLLHQGMILPWIPGVLAMVILLIPFKRLKPRKG